MKLIRTLQICATYYLRKEKETRTQCLNFQVRHWFKGESLQLSQSLTITKSSSLTDTKKVEKLQG